MPGITCREKALTRPYVYANKESLGVCRESYPLGVGSTFFESKRK
jgi:hypothetical protein